MRRLISSSLWQCLAAFILLTVLVVLALQFGSPYISVAEAQSGSPLADGSKTPWLIPDPEMVTLLMLTGTVPAVGASDIDQSRAQAFVYGMGLPTNDARVFETHANNYRRTREIPRTRSSNDAAAKERLDAATEAMNGLKSELSVLGWAKLAEFLEREKRNVKLYPIPDMDHHRAQAPGWREKLRALLEPRSVLAQGMTPYASLYTVMTVDNTTDDPRIFATGTTNAQSGCGCHDVSTYTTLTIPGGRTAGDTRYGYYEVAQATVTLTLNSTDSDGFAQASSTHNAYCPISQTQFVSGQQTAQSNPLAENTGILQVCQCERRSVREGPTSVFARIAGLSS